MKQPIKTCLLLFAFLFSAFLLIQCGNTEDNYKLHQALLNDEWVEAEKLLASGAEMDYHDEENNNILHSKISQMNVGDTLLNLLKKYKGHSLLLQTNKNGVTPWKILMDKKATKTIGKCALMLQMSNTTVDSLFSLVRIEYSDFLFVNTDKGKTIYEINKKPEEKRVFPTDTLKVSLKSIIPIKILGKFPDYLSFERKSVKNWNSSIIFQTKDDEEEIPNYRIVDDFFSENPKIIFEEKVYTNRNNEMDSIRMLFPLNSDEKHLFVFDSKLIKAYKYIKGRFVAAPFPFENNTEPVFVDNYKMFRHLLNCKKLNEIIYMGSDVILDSPIEINHMKSIKNIGGDFYYDPEWDYPIIVKSEGLELAGFNFKPDSTKTSFKTKAMLKCEKALELKIKGNDFIGEFKYAFDIKNTKRVFAKSNSFIGKVKKSFLKEKKDSLHFISNNYFYLNLNKKHPFGLDTAILKDNFHTGKTYDWAELQKEQKQFGYGFSNQADGESERNIGTTVKAGSKSYSHSGWEWGGSKTFREFAQLKDVYKTINHGCKEYFEYPKKKGEKVHKFGEYARCKMTAYSKNGIVYKIVLSNEEGYQDEITLTQILPNRVLIETDFGM